MNNKITLLKMKLITLLMFLFVNPGQVICGQDSKSIEKMLDEWHAAAANADQEAYFDFIHEDGYYLGTDSTEIWSKQQFYDWSKPYFEKGKAWDFTANSRRIRLDKTGQFAWFDELINFGGGTFRGSGVVKKIGSDWKIMQYVLSLPVPNEKFKSVMQVINEEEMIEKEE